MLINTPKIPFKKIIIYGFLPNWIKIAIYKLKGHKISKNVKLSFGSVIIGDNVSIGEGCNLGVFTILRAKNIEISNHVNIGPFTFIDTINLYLGIDTVINNNVIIGGLITSRSSFRTGKRVKIGQNSFLNCTESISIGDDSGIGGHNYLFTHGSWLSQLDGFPVSFKSIEIGERVWLAWCVFVMPGVKLGNNIVVVSNSTITKSFENNLLISGSPAKVILDNYPKELSKNKKNELFHNMLNDFFDYLKLNGFQIELKKDHNQYDIIKNNLKSSIFIIINNKSKINFSDDNLIIKYEEYDFEEKTRCMIIDMNNKTRSGSSKVGEEFVKFISRYGIRFDRIQNKTR